MQIQECRLSVDVEIGDKSFPKGSPIGDATFHVILEQGQGHASLLRIVNTTTKEAILVPLSSVLWMKP